LNVTEHCQRSSDALLQNRTFAELTVGECASLSRTVTQANIDLFAVASGDVDLARYGASRPDSFATVIADGMLGAGLISSVVAARLPGPGATFLAHDLRFLRRIAIGSRLTASPSS
jgi:phosphate acetyltransferase